MTQHFDNNMRSFYWNHFQTQPGSCERNDHHSKPTSSRTHEKVTTELECHASIVLPHPQPIPPNFLPHIPSQAQGCNEKRGFASPGGSVIPGTLWQTTMGKPRGKSAE
ncbi:hypothetical protein VTK26DRAFT_587 [Humicola hyalothermophila]